MPGLRLRRELVCCGSCGDWWHQACHVPHWYPLPVGVWMCHRCTPARAAATVEAEDEASPTKKAAPIKKTIKKTKKKLDAATVLARSGEGPPPVRTNTRPRRAKGNYEEGRPEGDGWNHKDLHGLDAKRSRHEANTWTRLN